MAQRYGPRIVTDGLVLCLDASSPKCISPAGSVGFNNAAQVIKNLVSPSDTITTSSDLRLGNLTYYTIYGLTYPESSQTPANRDGITPGFNDTSSSMLLTFSRDLNYAVWDNATNSWVADSYFNGERLGGHCYDTYSSTLRAEEHAFFQSDHAAIKSAYPDATHIVVGSHAAENNDSDANTLAILQDLGGPSSWPTDRAEYILVGKPGLGADNAYIWQYQNNSDYVAHANVGLPIQGHKSAYGNYLDFDGSDDEINVGNDSKYNLNNAVTMEAWCKPNSSISDYDIIINKENCYEISWTSEGLRTAIRGDESWYWMSGTGAGTFPTNTWTHVCSTWSQSSGYMRQYINGVYINQASETGALTTNSSPLLIGRRSNSAPTYFWHGSIAHARVYDAELTAAQVKQNYEATKAKFGL